MPDEIEGEVIVEFTERDPRSGVRTVYAVGSSWSGTSERAERHLQGHDRHGPLIRVKSGDSPASDDVLDPQER
jgi:hypothetical protein